MIGIQRGRALISFYDLCRMDATILSDYPIDDRIDRDTLNQHMLVKLGFRAPIWQHTDMFKIAFVDWFRVHEWNISQLVDTTLYEYNPIENYDRYEVTDRTHAIAGTISNTSGGESTINSDSNRTTTGDKTGSEKTTGKDTKAYDETRDSTKTDTGSVEESRSGDSELSDTGTVKNSGTQKQDNTHSGSSSNSSETNATHTGNGSETLSGTEEYTKSAWNSDGYQPYDKKTSSGSTSRDDSSTDTTKGENSGSDSSTDTGTRTDDLTERTDMKHVNSESSHSTQNSNSDSTGKEVVDGSETVDHDSVVTGSDEWKEHDEGSGTTRTSESARAENVSHERGNENVTSRIRGNIGVTTTQKMIEEQRKVVMFNIYDYIVNEIKQELFLGMY